MRNGTVYLPVTVSDRVLSLAGIDSGGNQRPYGAIPVDKRSIKVYNSAGDGEWGYLLVLGK